MKDSVSAAPFSLPLWITKETKLICGLIAFGFAALIYMAANHFPIFPPQLLQMTWLDNVIPFVPSTVWIYTSEYVFFAVVFLMSRDMKNVNKYLYSFLALQTTSVAIFYLWPTTYPRDLYPLVQETMDPLTFRLFSHLRVVDAPSNCCPSLHVSSVFLSSFIYLDEQEKKFPFVFSWGTAIALSTLTTKQHYIVDVISGLGMAVAFYFIFHRWIPYHSVGTQPKR